MRPGLYPVLFGSSYCREAQTAFAAMTVQPSAALKRLYDSCIRTLLDGGLWTKLDALYLLNVETAQAARVNIKNPGTYNLTATSSPTFTAKVGYAGDGAAAFLNTNFNPTTAVSPNFVQNSASVGVGSTLAAQDVGGIFGYVSSSNATFLFPRFTDDTFNARMNSAAASATAASLDGSGVWHVNRSGSIAVQVYREGVSADTDTDPSVAPLNINLGLLKRNTAFYSGGVWCALIGSSFSGAEAATCSTILNAFKTGVDAL
jgi:hypothetical protein